VAIKLDGRTIAPLRRKIAGMRERAGNLIPAWDEFASWFGDQERRQFGTRGARWRALWPELAAATVADKRRDGYNGDTLVRTGALLRSISDRPLSVERIGRTDMTVGTRAGPARFHQYGTRRMPARPLIKIEQIAAEGAIGDAVLSWVLRGEPRIEDYR
jgi:phage gpG-like protein